MKKYLVTTNSASTHTYVVEAKNAEEAKEIVVERLYLGRFLKTVNGSSSDTITAEEA